MEDGMKFTCPRCGRSSEIEEDIGDFPVRCHRCASLLRRKSAAGAVDIQSPLQPLLTTRFRSGKANSLRRGMLADMLGARPAFDEQEPVIIHTHAATPSADAESPPDHPVLTRETRRVARHVRARQQRLHRAMLKASQNALGALGWVGLVAVALLSIGILVLQAKAATHR
jgi:hypothetical protein